MRAVIITYIVYTPYKIHTTVDQVSYRRIYQFCGTEEHRGSPIVTSHQSSGTSERAKRRIEAPRADTDLGQLSGGA